jgi:hypothetical protein
MKTTRVDLSPFALGFVKLVRFPQIAAGPLLAAILAELLIGAFAGGSGALGASSLGLAGLIAQLINSFGYALAVICADAAWRRDRAPLDEAWNEASKKAGDILIAALGFQFCIWVAGLIASMLLGALVGGLGVQIAILLATYFLIYTIPAAAIGGIPGGASIQISIERARANPIETLAVVVAYWLLTTIAPSFLAEQLTALLIPLLREVAVTISSVILIAMYGLCYAYLAVVIAKVYAGISFGRRYF